MYIFNNLEKPIMVCESISYQDMMDMAMEASVLNDMTIEDIVKTYFKNLSADGIEFAETSENRCRATLQGNCIYGVYKMIIGQIPGAPQGCNYGLGVPQGRKLKDTFNLDADMHDSKNLMNIVYRIKKPNGKGKMQIRGGGAIKKVVRRNMDAKESFLFDGLSPATELFGLGKKDLVWKLKPGTGANGLKFGMSRTQVRGTLPEKPIEYKKRSTSAQTSDAYSEMNVHMFYENDKLEAIEWHMGATVKLNGKQILPGSINDAKSAISDLMESDGDAGSWISPSMSIGITEAGGEVRTVLIGKPGYYD